MDYSEHFYVILFSNAPQSLYPDNTVAVFTCHYAQPINLASTTDKWEVGICEFTCSPINMGTIRQGVTIIGDIIILIYCDLISPQFLGAALIRCLRTFIAPSIDRQHTFEYILRAGRKNNISRYTRRDINDGGQAGRVQRQQTAYKSCSTFSAHSHCINYGITTSYKHF
jgi:hypothetical protein